MADHSPSQQEHVTQSSFPAAVRPGGVLSPDEFREIYVANMRKKFEEVRRRQAEGQGSTPTMAPRPRETVAQVPPIFREQPEMIQPRGGGDDNDVPQPAAAGRQPQHPLIDLAQHVINMVVQIALAAFVFTQGDTGMHFLRLFGILSGLKIVGVILGRFKFQRRRHDDDNDVRAEEHRVVLMGWRRVWYIMWKSAVTFFVSMLPTFRVEALEVELRMDGVVHTPQNHLRPEHAAAQL